MLELTNPWGRPIRPTLGPSIVAEVASERWQLAGYWSLRRAIFADEQGLFEGSDRDHHDREALPIVAQSQIAGMSDRVVGIVRIYESQAGRWYGGRLGVDRAHRRFGAIGGVLIEAAVCTAHALGCREFLATVQDANVRYFERHHFRVLEPIVVCGRPHQLMQADLAHYPARHVGARFLVLRAA